MHLVMSVTPNKVNFNNGQQHDGACFFSIEACQSLDTHRFALMLVPFDFSLGDIVSGIELLIDAVSSIRDANGAQDDYKWAGSKSKQLRNGLEYIEALSLDPPQLVHFSAAKAAVHDCLQWLDDFILQNAKFLKSISPHRQANGLHQVSRTDGEWCSGHFGSRQASPSSRAKSSNMPKVSW